MKVISKHIVPNGIESIRLLDYAIKHLTELNTRNGIKKAIKRNELILNGKATSTGTFVKANDIIETLEPQANTHKVFELKLEVLYEDDYLAVIFKPAGIGVSGNYFKTIQNAIPFNLKASSKPDRLAIPRPIHRLDNPTSGLLIIAKTHTSIAKLGNMLANNEITKHYNAIILGIPNNIISIRQPINKKEAHSKIELLKTIESVRFKQLSLVKLSPITGRTHQLRIHLAFIGCPILGDKEYGGNVKNLWGKGLFLCATELQFKHPISNKSMLIKKELPNKFNKIINRSI